MTSDGTATADPQANRPVCTIIAGPNGAGKTTFALTYLSKHGQSRNFVNADLIAAGLSPLDPDREQVEAGRLFLKEIHRFITDRESFAFETTLSGRGYLRMIRQLITSGWDVHLFYLWLPSVLLCIERVAERVSRGGHDIPTETIKRRYVRSLENLLNEYASLCTLTVCYDNSMPMPQLVFRQSGTQQSVWDPLRFKSMRQGQLR